MRSCIGRDQWCIVKYFLSKENFSLHDFHERVLHGLKQKSSFKLMVWGDDAEVKALETQNKVLAAMYDEEKSNARALTPEVRQEICETVQVPMEEFTDTIAKYHQLRDFHVWLVQRRERGEKMPENRDELMQIYRIERPAFLMPKRKERYSKQQSYYMRRRHHT